VGDTVAARTISITNAAPVTTLNDVLIGSVGAGPGPFSASGNLGAGLGAGQTDSSSLKVALDTSSAGVFTGQAGLSLASHDADLADLPLVTSPIALQAQVNNFADAVFSKIGGSGSFTSSGLSYVLDLGTILSDAAPLSTNLALANALLGGPQDVLDGSFTLAVDDFLATGFQAFGNLGAGQSLTNLSVLFDPSGHVPGAFSDLITLHPVSRNADGSFGLSDVMLTLQGTLLSEAPVPEPGTGMMIAAGVIALVGFCTRRRDRS
jgi:PEP-CTERM motif-containing protein